MQLIRLRRRARKMRKTQTPAEQALWERLRVGHGRWYRQYPFNGYIFDFYSPSIRLAVEVDGASHNSMNDAMRDNENGGKGVTTYRITNKDAINCPGYLMLKIKKRINTWIPRDKWLQLH